MISINNLTMGFSQRTLFRDVSLSIFPKEKIGLTGPNGAGKTTLFQIILGLMEPLSGNIQKQKNINIGYLPQESKFMSKKTILQELTEGDDRIKLLMKDKRKLEDEGKAATDRYGDVLHELEILGIYEIEHRVEKILSGLGFKKDVFDKPISQLSGGWQMRTLLAKLLVYPYDLLLLDEPTNYLDLNATLWLKNFLQFYNGAFVLISHDRVFLNDVTNYTIIMERAQMIKVKGNYETYEMQKDIQVRHLERKQKVIAKKRKQLEDFTNRFHAQPNKAAAVRNKRKMIERLEKIEIIQDKKTVGSFEFTNIKDSGYVVISIEGAGKSYGNLVVYNDLNLEITKGQRVCIIGPNGAGKSTLLKILAGVLTLDKGKLKLGYNVERGYFSQTRLDVLNENRTAFDEVSSAASYGISSSQVRTLLGLFNFHGDDVFKSVKVLSGGEKSRIILAKLLINPPNFMLLDEPTTHLDLDGVRALNEAFERYDGTMCFISHDLSFIKSVANCIVEVDSGKIKIYPGNLEYYLDKKNDKDIEILDKKRQMNEEGRRLKKQRQAIKGIKENAVLKRMHEQHKEAKKRLNQIKNELKKLDEEENRLDTESYVKSRHLSKSFDKRDLAILKEYGRRLKEIQTRLREIESTRKILAKERERISKK